MVNRKYEILIFDLDDTLTNHQIALKYSFQKLLKEFDLKKTTYENLEDFSIKYWEQWNRGDIVIPSWIKEEAEKKRFKYINRFYLFFQNNEITYETARKINEYFFEHLTDKVVLLPNVEQVLNMLSKNYQLVLATNSNDKHAFIKLEKTKIKHYFFKIITSSSGYFKPMHEFYDYMLKELSINDTSKMLIIGDGLSTDIQGAINYNIDSCWFNPNELDSDNINPTYNIKSITELLYLL